MRKSKTDSTVAESMYPRYDEGVKEFQKFCKEKGIDANILPWPEPVNDNQKNTNAYEMVKAIQLAENGGKLCDALDKNQWQYYPYFYNSSGSGLSFYKYDFWCTASGVPARLCVLDSKNVEANANRFMAIYDCLQR